MEYTKGDRVLFGNGTSLLEGVVQKIFKDGRNIYGMFARSVAGDDGLY